MIRLRDTYWDISLYNVSTSGKGAVSHARTWGIDPRPELETRLQTDLTIDDVAVSDSDWREGYYGMYFCIVIRSDGLCEEARIRFDTIEIASSADPSWQWKKTGIHEFGHAAGLGHRFTTPLSAMMQGDAKLNGISMFFDSHDESSISANY